MKDTTYKTKFAHVCDVIFLAICFFVGFFILLNYFIGRINAIVLSLWLTLFFTLLSGKKMTANYRGKALGHAQQKECKSVLASLSLMPPKEIANLFFCAFEKDNLYPQKKNGGVATKDKVYFFKFSFDPITKTDVVKFFNRITNGQTAVICCESFSKEVYDFVLRFNNKVQLMDGKTAYLLLKKHDCLPKQTAEYSIARQVTKPRLNFTARKNAKKLFVFGVTFCALSFFVPIKLYYIVCGCVLLCLSVLIKLFGHDEKTA